MTLHFYLLETQCHALWDYGWFDVSRFAVDGASGHDSIDVLREFMLDPISQRSFCSGGEWGESIERHGPFLRDAFDASWFRSVSFAELSDKVQETLDDPEFSEPPSSGQRAPVLAFIRDAETRGDAAFVLEAGEQLEVRVDWDFVWIIYREFVCLSSDHEQLTVAVIGYD
jgi:hypothetical protein